MCMGGGSSGGGQTNLKEPPPPNPDAGPAPDTGQRQRAGMADSMSNPLGDKGMGQKSNVLGS